MGSDGARALDRIAESLQTASTTLNWMPTKHRQRLAELATEVYAMAEDTRDRYNRDEDEEGHSNDRREQCGQCGAEVLGYHQCQGMPGSEE